MLLQEPHGSHEISLVEVVGNIPAERAELFTLLEDGVEESQRVQQPSPLRSATVLQYIIGKTREGTFQARLYTLRWFVRESQGYLG